MDRFDSPRQRFRWPLAILGAIFIVLGLWAFSRPGGAISGIVWAFALGILFKGVMDIAVWYDMGKAGVKRPTYVLLTGILDILFAILLFANSLLSTLFIAYLFAAWFLVDSIASIAAADFSLHRTFNIVMGILGIIVGIAMLFNPLYSVITLAYLVAAYLLIFGVILLTRAF